MRKVVSIALFSRDGESFHGTPYHDYLTTFVLAHANLFPKSEGWYLVVHVDDATLAHAKYRHILEKLRQADLIELRAMGSAPKCKAMLWRLSPIFEAGTDYVFCRDVDSLPCPRDRACCDTFIASGLAVHTIHDAPVHVGVMGGLCGFNVKEFQKATFLRSMTDVYSYLPQPVEWEKHGTDQEMLNRVVNNSKALTLLEHRYNGWHCGPKRNPSMKRGVYGCAAKSAPTPDLDASKADILANHLGSAGYDRKRARDFWRLHGRAGDVARVIDEIDPVDARLRTFISKKRFSVRVVDETNPRSANRCFIPFAQALREALRRLGYEVVDSDSILPHRTILLGANKNTPAGASDSIFYNAEQLVGKNPREHVHCRADQIVWDFSETNAHILRDHGFERVVYCPVGYIDTMETVPRDVEDDIDVLFYGLINERRAYILDDLEASGLKVTKLFGIYGRELDTYIARSKIVLNLHYYDNASFEIFRCAHLFANRKCVVSEDGGVDPALEELAESAALVMPHSDIRPYCVKLAYNTHLRLKQEEKAYETFKKLDLVEHVRRALECST